MKEYKFLVGLCGGWCDGTLTVKANYYDEAYNKACDTVVERLVKVFPELEIDYDIEPAEDVDELDGDETNKVIKAVDNALHEYPTEYVDVVRDEETDMLNVMYHSWHNSFAIFEDVAHIDNVDMDRLGKYIDFIGVGYCL